MRLNPDCIRDILFFVEENTSYTNFIILSRRLDNLNINLKNQYSSDEILYHLILCDEYGYLVLDNSNINDFHIMRLTTQGHEFLEDIRNNNTWNKVKTKGKEIGSFSLNILSQIVADVLTNSIINNH